MLRLRLQAAIRTAPGTRIMAMDSLDRNVGNRVREMRLDRKLSMRAVADAIGASEDDIWLFEAGLKRIGAPRLLRLAKVFDVPVSAFFAPGGPAQLIGHVTGLED